MGTVDLRRKIASGGVIPALPGVFRGLLCGRAARSDDLSHWGAIAAADPDLARALAAEAGIPGDSNQIAARLGAAGLRRVALRQAMERLFPTAGGKRLDRRTFWRHALLCAGLSERLAQTLGSRFEAEAYGAGLLHDIGKVVLDLASPEGYSKALEVARTQALFVLDAERRELGVDHTLVGKWSLEFWGLPEAYQAVAWLHHHPPGTLDDALYPVELTDIVALADVLARAQVTGLDAERTFSAAEEQRKRLGISRETLRAVFEGTERGDGPQEAVDSAVPMQIPDPASWSRRLMRLQALSGFHRKLLESMEPSAVLCGLAESLRNAFSVTSGFCYAEGVQESGLLGAVWKPGDAVPRQVLLRMDGGEGTADPVLDLLATLREAGGISHRNGLVAVPILFDGTGLGQIVFESPQGALSDEDLAELLDFGRACGWALTQWRARQRLAEEGEALSTAIWRQELAHRQALRAERLSGLGQLASGAAHVINNPLTAISGRAQMLLNRMAGPEEARSLETIIRQSRRISKILSDLMQFARPSEPQLESVLLSFVLHQVLGTMRERIEARGIRILEEYAQPLPRVRADRHQLEQVFVNLVLNAEQAMDKGGTLSAVVKAGPDRRSVVVQVADTGHGIPPDAMDRVFEPFFTTREEAENTGLGLSVCHGIIERHRGAIALHSTLGHGTTCTITLPAAAEAEQHPAAHAMPLAAPAPARVRELPVVLIADPDEELREFLGQMLRGRGYETILASDGLETLAAVLSRPVDLLLLDQSLLGPDRAPVLQHLRDRRITAPILLMSGPGHDEAVEDFVSDGVLARLSKPFPLERLLGIIQQTLESRSVA